MRKPGKNGMTSKPSGMPWMRQQGKRSKTQLCVAAVRVEVEAMLPSGLEMHCLVWPRATFRYSQQTLKQLSSVLLLASWT